MLILSGLYLCLSLAYGLANPPFEANDELAHYLYIRQLVIRRQLPVQQIPAGKDYQNHHPPLYYLLGSMVSFWVDDSDLATIIKRGNPFWGYDPWAVGRDNKNQFLYTSFERFPNSGSVLRLRLVRFVSTLIGLVTVLATYGAAREVFPSHRDIALGSLAFINFHPMFLYLSGAINNDNLIIFFGACTTWSLMRLVRWGFSWPRILTLGVILGLALISKITAIFLFPVVGVGLLFTAWIRNSWRMLWRATLTVATLILVLSGWWFVRNLRLYGDPTGMRILLSSIKGITYSARPSLWQGLKGTVRFQKSLWACFGWNTIPIPYSIYWVLDGIVLIAAGGVLKLAYHCWSRGNRVRLGQIFLLVLVVILFIFAWAYYMTVSQTSGYGRYTFPALSAMGVLLFGGLSHHLRPQWTPFLAGATNLVMFSFALFCLLGILIPAYARPRLMEPAEVASIPHRLDFDFGQEARLLGYDIQSGEVEPGEKVYITLYWQELQAIEENYIIYVHIFGQQGSKIGQRDTYPGTGRFATTLWKPGDVFADRIGVPIHPNAGRPVLARIEAGLYARQTKRRLPVFDSEGRSLDQTIIGQLKIPPSRREPVVIPHPVDYSFGDTINMTGYGIQIEPEGDVIISLYWRVLSHPTQDYTVFVHLLDEEDTIIAQGDSQPLEGDYPTSIWAPGELVVDPHAISLETKEYSERFRWRTGLYDLTTGDRVPAYGPNGLRLPADQVELETE